MGPTPMESKTSAMLMNVLSILLNVGSSVFIIFVNKNLMDPARGYGFMFATTLCALHFFASGAFVKTLEFSGYSEAAAMPLYDALLFAGVASLSVSSMNLSLMFNSVGFYQIAKLLVTPCVGVIEYVWLSKHLSMGTISAIGVVVAGVAIVTVSDVSVNIFGLVIATLSVLAGSLQQVLCGHMQRKCGITSNQLLSNTAPWQGLILISCGPMLDLQLTHRWVLDYQFEGWAATLLLLTCAVAVLVNVSQFLCLGRFSAITFSVLGHSKTMLVLLFGWAYLGEEMTMRKLSGMLLAVLGMVLYGWLQSPSTTAGGTAKVVDNSGRDDDDLESAMLLTPVDIGGLLAKREARVTM